MHAIAPWIPGGMQCIICSAHPHCVLQLEEFKSKKTGASKAAKQKLGAASVAVRAPGAEHSRSQPGSYCIAGQQLRQCRQARLWPLSLVIPCLLEATGDGPPQVMPTHRIARSATAKTPTRTPTPVRPRQRRQRPCAAHRTLEAPLVASPAQG